MVLPTPCTECDLRVLVNHVTYENLWATELFAGKTMKQVGDRFEGDVLGAEPLAAHTASVEPVARAATALGVMEALCEISMGPTPGAEYPAQVLLDLLIHRWDIAKDSGQDARKPPDLIAACMPIATRISNFLR
ncbi:MAG: maleylpyruvate isomerase family mycothiol-dependent enzyme [Chloroflexota bacterium]